MHVPLLIERESEQPADEKGGNQTMRPARRAARRKPCQFALQRGASDERRADREADQRAAQDVQAEVSRKDETFAE